MCTKICVQCCSYRSWFCSPARNQISLSQSKGRFPFIMLCRWEKYHWTGLLGCQHMYSYVNIFFTAELKQASRMILPMYYFCESHELWKMSTVLSTYHNWELLIARPHRALCFKKITTTTTAFLIFNTVVPNPYSNSTTSNPQSYTPLS